MNVDSISFHKTSSGLKCLFKSSLVPQAFFELVGSKQPETFEQLLDVLPSLKDETGTYVGGGTGGALTAKVRGVSMETVHHVGDAERCAMRRCDAVHTAHHSQHTHLTRVTHVHVSLK